MTRGKILLGSLAICLSTMLHAALIYADPFAAASHVEAGECIFAEINKSGIAGAAYKTPEEVQKAVQMLNGSTFEGHTLEVDVWQKKTPEGGQ